MCLRVTKKMKLCQQLVMRKLINYNITADFDQFKFLNSVQAILESRHIKFKFYYRLSLNRLDIG